MDHRIRSLIAVVIGIGALSMLLLVGFTANAQDPENREKQEREVRERFERRAREQDRSPERPERPDRPERPERPFPGRPGDFGPGRPGFGPPPFMMGPGGGTAIAATQQYVYVVQGNQLFQFRSEGLQLVKRVELEMPRPPFPGEGRPGGEPPRRRAPERDRPQ